MWNYKVNKLLTDDYAPLKNTHIEERKHIQYIILILSFCVRVVLVIITGRGTAEWQK